MGAADIGGARLRQADEAHLAGLDQPRHGADDLLDRHRGVDPVLVEQVDVVEAEAPQRGVDHLTDVLGAAVDAGGLAVRADAEAELGRHHDAVAAAFQGLAEQRLVGEGPVDLGGVEIGDAELEGAVDRGDRFGVVRRAVGLAHAHAAEADGRNREPLAAEFAGGQHGRVLVERRGNRMQTAGRR